MGLLKSIILAKNLKTNKMRNLRNELQNWLEAITRYELSIPAVKEVVWEDIENVYNSFDSKAMYYAQGKPIPFEEVYTDSVGIDHISQEHLVEDVEKILNLTNKYFGVQIF